MAAPRDQPIVLIEKRDRRESQRLPKLITAGLRSYRVPYSTTGVDVGYVQIG